MTPETSERAKITSWQIMIMVVIVAMVTGLPYWVPGWQLPKTEDFEYTILPTAEFFRQLATGSIQWWNPMIGLGSPWPIPTGMTHSPLGFLFLAMPPMGVVGVVIVVHNFLLGWGSLLLFRRYRLPNALALVAVFTVQLSTSLEYIYWSDAIAVYATWSLVPWLFYFADRILEDGSWSATGGALGLGVTVGYAALNGHTGVLSIYLIGLALFVCSRPARALRRSPLFLLAVVLAATLAAEKLVYLISEIHLFAPTAYRDQQGLQGGIPALIYNVLLRPLFLPNFNHVTELGGWLSGFVGANNFSRTLGFGVVFTLAAFAALWRPSSIPPMPGRRALFATFVGSLILMLWPIAWLPSVISAAWPLRDVAMLTGVILAGHLIARWPQSFPGWSRRVSVRRLLFVQVAVVSISAVALIAGPNWFITRGKATVGFYNSVTSPEARTPYSTLLRAALDADGRPGGRFVASGMAERWMDIEQLVDQGGINNLGFLYGFSEVSFIAKGLSYDAIRPSQYVPYGTIAGDRMQRWGLDLNKAQDWTVDNQALLTFLGIEGVVATQEERVTAPGLAKIGELPGIDGYTGVVYANSNVLPTAFVVPRDLLGLVPPRRCVDAGLYCLDLRQIVGAANADGITTSAHGDRIEVTVDQIDDGADILVTQMYRPDWTVVPPSESQLTSWHGIMRLQIAPGVKTVELVYQPERLMLARWITLMAASVAFAAVIGYILCTKLLTRRDSAVQHQS